MKKSTKPYILKLRKHHSYIHFKIEEVSQLTYSVVNLSNVLLSDRSVP